MEGYEKVDLTEKLEKRELKPGESAKVTYEHKVTEQDILEGQVVNVATASGKDPDGKDPDVTPGRDPEPTTEKDPHLTVTKVTTSKAKAESGKYALDEVITYEITVLNDGNVTITDLGVTDTVEGYEKVDLTEQLSKRELKPGESVTVTYEHKVTEQDVLNGEVVNNATANGKDPDGDEPKVDPGKDPEPTTEKDPHLTVTKVTTSQAKAETGKYSLDEVITYEITVLNDGNVTITDISVTDTVEGYEAVDLTEKLEKRELKPGESVTVTFEHKVTEKDVEKGEVVNVATATGKDPEGDEPEVTPGRDPEPVNQNTTLTVIKVWEDNNDQDGMRPASLTVSLMADGERLRQEVLNADNSWKTEVSVPIYNAEGKKITYQWTEPTIEYYDGAAAVDGATTTFTNTYRPAMTTLTVYKEWRDANDPNARPLSITVYLTGSDGSSYSQVLSANDNWQWTVSVPMYHNGKLITYTWTESTVRGYRGTQTTTGNVTVFVNTRTGGGVVPPTPPTPETIDEPGTPLGLGQVYINVGDCLE